MIVNNGIRAREVRLIGQDGEQLGIKSKREALQLAEDAKIHLRNIRQDANKMISSLKLPEDEEKRSIEEVQDLINKYNKEIESKLKDKEKDLMTI